jgi:DNA helicase-2/ATP-dependent DNA helicase PcrA
MNTLMLAVAGGRKTQSIVDRCAAAPAGRRILVLTYTIANQQELRTRLERLGPLEARVEVEGWFAFLLRHWVRPYLPSRFTGARLRGLNFDGDPGYVAGIRRFLDSESRAYKRHLAQLALDVDEASVGASLNRLARIHEEIWIDEVQDLNGYDLEVLSALLASPIEPHLVGDVRQALLRTNPRDPKNQQYKGINIKTWFEQQAQSGWIEIKHASTTWRCNQRIADFADSIFPNSWGFSKTVSRNVALTGHDGVFAVASDHVGEYTQRFNPLCLRNSTSSGKQLDLPFTNIGKAKGLEDQHVLVAPTDGVTRFLAHGTSLGDTPCCSLYVAVTRARSSVAFVTDKPERVPLEFWRP